MFESLNAKRTVMEGVDTSEMKFHKLKDFANSTIPCRGFFFTEDKLSGGQQVVVVTDTCLVNMPKRAVKQFEKIVANEQMLDAVLEGKLSIEVKDMVKTKTGATIDYKMIG